MWSGTHKKIRSLIQSPIICQNQKKTSMCLLKCVNSEVQNKNDCVVRRSVVKNSHGLLRKKEIKEGVAIAAFRSILFFASFFILLSSLWQRKSGLVLNFSMELNSVYTIQNYKVFIQYFYRKITAT